MMHAIGWLGDAICCEAEFQDPLREAKEIILEILRMRGFHAGVLTGLTLLLGACTVSPDPGPEARAAAEQLAADINARSAYYSASPNQTEPDIRLFARVFERVRSDYVRAVDQEILLAAAATAIEDAGPGPGETGGNWLVERAIKGMLESLDPYSTYLPENEYTAMKESMRGRFGGLGIQIAAPENGGGILVVTPLEGTPAERAGLRPGDLITHVDGNSVMEKTLREVVTELRGSVGSRVVLTIERELASTFDVPLIRDVIHMDVVKWRLEGEFGYLRIASFTENAAEEVEQAIQKIRQNLGGRMAGLIIDLRNNPGGLLVESVAVSDAFIESGDIVSTRGRKSKQRYRATTGDIAAGLPIVVLINKGSASAAEILAGALKDHNRAILVGGRSYGKGTVQTVIPMGQGTAMKLTTAQYFRPLGDSVEGGILPDVEAEDDFETELDEGLERAIAELSRMASL
jgi:carboxyl-terminal processing protease